MRKVDLATVQGGLLLILRLKKWIPGGTAHELLAMKVSQLRAPGGRVITKAQRDLCGRLLVTYFEDLGARIPNPGHFLSTNSLSIADVAQGIHDSQEES